MIKTSKKIKITIIMCISWKRVQKCFQTLKKRSRVHSWSFPINDSLLLQFVLLHKTYPMQGLKSRD